jgi:cytochrome c
MPSTTGLLLASAVVTGLLLASAPATASAALSQKAGCAMCHQVDKKGLGPSYRDIASKYRGDGQAPARMVERVRKGSKGVWGKVPMQPVPAGKISDADLDALIAWMLKQ